jgi:tripartite ATP-independent transporter DctM subunit
MAAMVGVVGAEIVTLGMIALPQLMKNKYDDTLALGALAAGGGLATLIPPSVVLIVYSMTAGVSVAHLFTAGILPGLILAAGFVIFILVHVKRHPEAAPLPPEELRNLPLIERFKSLRELALPLPIIFGILASIYMGIATPNEAAGVGVVLVMIAAIINRKFNLKILWDSCQETLKVSCMLAWLFFGAQCVIGAYTLAGGTYFVRDAILSLDLGVWGTLIMMNLIWIVLGCFLDWMGILFLTIPIFLPVILKMGLDPIWFGILYCMNMQVSYLSPPFAPSSFYMKSIAPEEITMMRIYKGSLPYLIVTFSMLCILTVWQDLPLYLVRMMR